MKMEKRSFLFLTLSFVALAAFLAGPPCNMQAVAPAFAGVKGTPHDLSSLSNTTGPKAVSNTEECVFCHTPHVAYPDSPLWNHQYSSVANYTEPSSSTQLSTPTNPPDGSSKLCLSCHDGTVALGAVRWAWTPGGPTSLIAMEGAGMNGAIPSMYSLGTDLSGTHLVSIAVNPQLINDKEAQYNQNLTSLQLQYPCNGAPDCAVKLEATANLYKGIPGEDAQGRIDHLGVQCGSCHDPHDNSNGDFLVLPVNANTNNLNQQSGPLCGACHQTL